MSVFILVRRTRKVGPMTRCAGLANRGLLGQSHPGPVPDPRGVDRARPRPRPPAVTPDQAPPVGWGARRSSGDGRAPGGRAGWTDPALPPDGGPAGRDRVDADRRRDQRRLRHGPGRRADRRRRQPVHRPSVRGSGHGHPPAAHDPARRSTGPGGCRWPGHPDRLAARLAAHRPVAGPAGPAARAEVGRGGRSGVRASGPADRERATGPAERAARPPTAGSDAFGPPIG